LEEIMLLEQVIVEKLRRLPAEKQQTVLEFVEFLQSKSGPLHPRHNPIGLCADLKLEITEADITTARREMWGNFPREIEL
jgi:hypothetical protein